MRYDRVLQILLKDELHHADYRLFLPERNPERVFIANSGRRYTGTDEQIVKQMANLICTRVHREYCYTRRYLEVTDQPPLHDTINVVYFTLTGPLKLNELIKDLLKKWVDLYEILEPPSSPATRPRSHSC